jgi:hypothetical protein
MVTGKNYSQVGYGFSGSRTGWAYWAALGHVLEESWARAISQWAARRERKGWCGRESAHNQFWV